MTMYILECNELLLLFRYSVNDSLSRDFFQRSDADLSEEQASAAFKALVERDWLVRAPLEIGFGISGEIAFQLDAMLFPETVAIMQVRRQNADSLLIHVSFSQVCTVHNYVNSQGQHVITELSDLDAVAQRLLEDSGAAAVEQGVVAPQHQPLAGLIEEAQAVAVLLIVNSPSQPDGAKSACSWLVARDRLWLVDPSSPPDTPQAQEIDAPDLKQTIAALFSSTLLPVTPNSAKE